MINNKTLEAARGRDKAYKLADRDGLYIAVLPSGAKSWRYNYTRGGKHYTKTYGKWPAISIAEARALHFEFRNSLDRVDAKKPLFDAVKDEWLRHHLPELKNIKHKKLVIMRLDTYVSPHIGKVAVDKITRADLVKIVKAIQSELNLMDTAHRVATHIRQVLDYAVDCGYIDMHPAAGLSRVLKTPKAKSMPCVPVSDTKLSAYACLEVSWHVFT